MSRLRFLEKREEGFPLYLQLKEELEEMLRGGSYKPGARFLSYRQIADAAGISRITAQRAIKEIVSEGLLVEDGKKILIAERREKDKIRRLGVVLSPWDRNGQALAYDNSAILATMFDLAAAARVHLDLIPHQAAQQPFDTFRAQVERLGLDTLVWLGLRPDTVVNAALFKGKIAQLCLQNRPEHFDLPLVGEDNRAAARLAMATVLREGRAVVGVIHSPKSIMHYARRLEGVDEALATHAGPAPRVEYLELPETPRGEWYGRTVAEFLGAVRPEAVVLLTHCFDDVCRAYADSGHPLPDVIGFEPPESMPTPPRRAFRYFAADYAALGRAVLEEYDAWTAHNDAGYEKLVPMTLRSFQP